MAGVGRDPQEVGAWGAAAHAGVAGVLAAVKREGMERKGQEWSADEEAEFKKPIVDSYEHQGHPYYASARLWDDGVIDPAQTREVVALSLSATLNRPAKPTRFGVFRM